MAAPIGTLLAVRFGRCRRSRLFALVAVAAAPTAVTWVAEVAFGVPGSGFLRALAALPLGAVLAGAVVALLLPATRSNQLN